MEAEGVENLQIPHHYSLLSPQAISRIFSPGWTSTKGSAVCVPCPRGHYCPDQAASPKPCITGQVAPETGNFKCALCPAGESNAGNGQK